MSLSRTIAGWIMRTATKCAPAEQGDLALAMQCEFYVLNEGELGWAAGCAATVLRWQLHANGLYLSLLLLAPMTFEYLTMPASLAIGQEIPRHFQTLLALFTPLPLALAIGLYRPDRTVMTMLVGGLVGHHVGLALQASYFLGVPLLAWWGPHSTLYMAPPLVGLCASLGVWYFGASLGAKIGKRRVLA